MFDYSKTGRILTFLRKVISCQDGIEGEAWQSLVTTGGGELDSLLQHLEESVLTSGATTADVVVLRTLIDMQQGRALAGYASTDQRLLLAAAVSAAAAQPLMTLEIRKF